MNDAAKAACVRWFGTMHPYQRRWILERARFAQCNKARQIGLSHANAAGCVYGARVHGRPQLVLSASQDLADEVLTKARAHAHVLAALGFPGADHFTTNNATEIAWANGGRVIALPANPRTARSFTGDVWLDEAAYMLDPEGVRDAAFPIAMRGGWRVRMVSTPNGAAGMFHDYVTHPRRGWASYTITIEDAIADGLDLDLDELWQLCGGDARLFGQWFRCAFLDADLQYLPTLLVDAAGTWHDMPDLTRATFYAGFDVARFHDLSALAVVAVVGHTAWCLPLMTCKRTSFEDQKTLLADARALFRWETLHVDANGLGTQLAEELVEKWGEDEVIPVAFGAPDKERMATRLFKYLANGALRTPRDESGKQLRAEMVALRRIVTQSNVVTYKVPRTAEGHGDRLWALALALLGAGEPALVRGMGARPLGLAA